MRLVSLTSELLDANGQEPRQSCRSLGTENPADAGFLFGGNRPTTAIHKISMYVRLVAYYSHPHADSEQGL